MANGTHARHVPSDAGALSRQQTKFEKALDHHRKGESDNALNLCHAILADGPHFDAAHLLGAIHLQRGEAKPAAAYFRSALAIEPHAPYAWANLGTSLKALRHYDQALASLDRAISLMSDHAAALHSRANLLRLLDRPAEALEDYDRAIALHPSNADLFYNRGSALDALENHREAAASYERALVLRPNFPEALNNLCMAFRELGRLEEALAASDRALALRQGDPAALVNRANILTDLGRFDEALATFDAAIASDPGHAPAFNNRGTALREMRRFDEAIESYTRALAIRPDYAEAEWNRGLTQLLIGNWHERWDGYEARFRTRKNNVRRPQIAAAEWTGESLEGKSLFVFAEQGLGDAMQFIRFVSPLVASGACVTVQAHRTMHRILGTAVSGIEWLSDSPKDRAFDYQIALMSLPRVLGITPSNVPNRVPYLTAQAARISRWREKIGSRGFKVGICWQGNPAGSIDRGRSIPLREFAPLARVPGIRLFSLQKNHGLDQLERLRGEMPVEGLEDFDEGPDAFLDSAAVMASLDVVVTSDTSIAHLAGALGRRVFIALKRVPDWRWLSEGNTTPWYPSARLFRQREAGRWDDVFCEIAETLQEHD